MVNAQNMKTCCYLALLASTKFRILKPMRNFGKELNGTYLQQDLTQFRKYGMQIAIELQMQHTHTRILTQKLPVDA